MEHFHTMRKKRLKKLIKMILQLLNEYANIHTYAHILANEH